MQFPDFALPGVALAVLGVALLTLERVWPDRTPVVVAVAPVEELPLGETAAVAVAAEAEVAPVTWPRAIDRDAGELTEAERRTVIDGLGIVGDAWSTSLLLDAYNEERGALRVVVVENMGRCDDERVGAALERAYASPIVEERYAAIDGASRRADIALLERGMRDGDRTVATAAAYGLRRAGRNDLLAAMLAVRDHESAQHIRATLETLGAL